MKSEFTVFSVDDDPFILDVVRNVIGADYVVETFDSVAECQRRLDTKKPDMFLLDVRMPGMDGYDFCRLIKSDADLCRIPVTFVSSHDTTEARLAGYDAGGEDFVLKPFAPKELLRKVAMAIRMRENFLRLAKEKADAEEMSTMAIEGMDEMTAVQKFLRGILGCRSLTSLGELVISSLSAYGCESCVQLRASTETVTLTPHGEASPLELSIFDQTKNLERIFQFRSRMIINYDRISLLITNMPAETDALAGRIRDYGAIVAEAADAGIEGISLRLEVVGRATEMQALARESRDSIEQLREQSAQQQGQARCELEQMVERVESMYYRLGLSPHQEELISDTTRDTANIVLELFDLGAEFDERFAGILAGLEKASEIPVENHVAEVASTEVWL